MYATLAAIALLEARDAAAIFSDLMRFAPYVHGTHVAGIAVEGNPFARVLVARLTADHRMVPPAPTLEEFRRTAEMFRDVVAYFRAHDVRRREHDAHCRRRRLSAARSSALPG